MKLCMSNSWVGTLGTVAVLLSVRSAPAAPVQTPPPVPTPPQVSPQTSDGLGPLRPQVIEETAPLTIKDSRGISVTLRIPVSLHRPANAFRLYGGRPLTLQSFERRRDLYRDAFLELVTQSGLQPRVSMFDTVGKQAQWLGDQAWRQLDRYQKGQNPRLPRVDLSLLARDPRRAARQIADTARLGRPGPISDHVGSVLRAVGQNPPSTAKPVVEALTLRAVAADAAEARLRGAGRALGFEPGYQSRDLALDPAMRAGYQSALTEFGEVQKGLWPAIVSSVYRNQGKLVIEAVKKIALSSLGFWAVFGYLGFQGAESAMNAEYRGQYSICLATLEAALLQAGAATPAEEAYQLALAAECSLNYQLTEALKRPALFPLEPAGGKSPGQWQMVFSQRWNTLRTELTARPPISPAAGALPESNSTTGQ